MSRVQVPSAAPYNSRVWADLRAREFERGNGALRKCRQCAMNAGHLPRPIEHGTPSRPTGIESPPPSQFAPTALADAVGRVLLHMLRRSLACVGVIALLALCAAGQNQSWIRQFGSPADDQLMGATPDGSAGVYVVGFTSGSLGGPNAGGEDVWLARYDGAGTQLWIRQFGTSADDYAHSAAPDGSGGVYIQGFTSGSLGGPNAGNLDAWFAHFERYGTH